MDSVIVTRGLTRRFGGSLAVDELTIEVHAGEVFGFLGHNGAGKTTTVRLLNGVLNPSSGEASVLGIDPSVHGDELRRRTGVLTETASLDERLTARENLQIYAELFGVAPRRLVDRVESLLASFNLVDRANDPCGGFSKGMKQRLALARALLHEPEVLFLDEPTAALDPAAARQVHELIIRLSREEKRTVFLCTHNLTEAAALCDRVAVLEHGRLLAMGAPTDLACRYGGSSSLEIDVTTDSLALAFSLLETRPDVQCLNPRNGTLSISGVTRDAIPSLVSGLVAAGVSIYRVTPLEASLEDVYFALQGRTEGTAC